MKNKKIGLMLVEDPRDTINALCRLKKTEINWNDFKIEYEKIKFAQIYPNIFKGSKKNIDAHFYTLTTFHFLVPYKGKKGLYILGNHALELCRGLGKNDISNIRQFHEIFSSILLENERKGELFRCFQTFVSKGKNREQIYSEFGNVPSKTLIAWTKFAGLTMENKNVIQAVPDNKENLTQASFMEKLENFYNRLESTGEFGIKRLFIPFGELRFLFFIQFGTTKEEFDFFLRMILDSEYRSLISLSGGTVDSYNEDNRFFYNDKNYLYISLKK
jgi:hypothetical protein